MTIRNLDAIFRPRSVALIGASRRPGSVGAVVARNMAAAGFAGPLYAVHPDRTAFEGFTTFSDIQSLPTAPDLAVIATPPDTVPGLVAALGARGTRGAVVITAGFGESKDESGPARQRAMLMAAKPHTLRIVGPNCVGIAVPGMGLNASFAHIAPRPGRIAFVAQSGAVLTSVLDWATSRGIGFSHLVSLGGMADVDFGDMLDYLANDPGTRAILLYVEAITNARKFMSAARAAARLKPVVAVKAGRRPEGAAAASSHTGALAGHDGAYDAAFRRAGILRVTELDELFDAVETLAHSRAPTGNRVAIVTNGGGIGVMATDTLIDRGGRLAALSPATIARLDGVLPRTWSRGNPVDIIGDADGARYEAALKAVFDDGGVDAVLVLNCPVAVASATDAADAVIRAAAGRDRPLFTSWLGADGAAEARRRFAEAAIPTYDTPAQAVRAIMHLVDRRRGRENLMEVPPAQPDEATPDRAAVRAILDRALAERREWLMAHEAKAVLAAFGVPVVEDTVASDGAAAVRLAARLAGPAVLKILSPDITHKSDLGGVALDLATPDAVRAAAEAMWARVRAARPDALLLGFLVSPMIRRPHALELIVGASTDPTFGPLILFGQGGTAVEVVGDTALALPPLNIPLARDLIARTRIARLLAGYRDRKPADLDLLARILVAVSGLVADFPEIAELDINPLLADDGGAVALDARIRVAPASGIGSARLAITPYPRELARTVCVPDGRTLLLRPVRPEDEAAFRRAFDTLDPEDIRMRFHASICALTRDVAARLTQIDYDREMAFVLTDPKPTGLADIHGVARMHADPDNVAAEYAVIVASGEKGRGLGYLLMRALIDHAKRRGLKELFGHVMRSNAAMLKLCGELGFANAPVPDAPEIVRVSLAL